MPPPGNSRLEQRGNQPPLDQTSGSLRELFSPATNCSRGKDRRLPLQEELHLLQQAAKKALESYTVYNKSVAEAKRLLNKLAEYNNTVNLHWIPAHSGQLGNGIADGLAKYGANHPDLGMEPRIPASECVIKAAIRRWGKDQQQHRWDNKTDCRQSKLILPQVNHTWAGGIYNYDRRHIKVLTQLVTGHANLKRHRSLMGLEDNANCDRCGEPQESVHILTECPGLVGTRIAIFGKPILGADEVKALSVYKILKFARETGYWNL